VSERDDGGSAFPRWSEREENYGMSLRDYFAAKALNALLSNRFVTILESAKSPEDAFKVMVELAPTAYEIADAMLRTRKS